MTGQNRNNVRKGIEVDIVLKRDQKTGKLTRGIVSDILTNSLFHPHGIKVRLESGEIGRIQNIVIKKYD
ncbi:MAG: YwbE family protein [Candidatus Pacebacteria bacterium]|nr:YwbE family protein [Candidatus Paceibacterota bacterium]